MVTHRFDSIAVLPFKKRGDEAILCRRSGRNLTASIVTLKGLRVSARTSSFEFESSQQDFKSIGNKLGVATLLTGSIQSSLDMRRIIIQLINVQDGSHLWSKTFDYTDQNMFTIPRHHWTVSCIGIEA